MKVLGLKLPPCTTKPAPGKNVKVPSGFTSVPAANNPFGIQVSHDGKFVFAVTSLTVEVYSRSASSLALTHLFSYTVTVAHMGAAGATMTSNGKYLLVAAGSGIVVLDVHDLEAGISPATVGTLTVPGIQGNGGAVEVAVSPDNHFAFVTLKNVDIMATFNLHKALKKGFTSQAFVGEVRLGTNTVGLALSPDGKWIYVTSYAINNPNGNRGLISVLRLTEAERNTKESIVSQGPAGCMPARVIASPDGKTVWVTARGSNALLGFSAPTLRTDPKQALVADVPVGKTPIGIALVNGNSRLIVANTNIPPGHPKQGVAPPPGNLAVVKVAAALAGKPALLGYIPSGSLPREFGIVPGGRNLIISDNGSLQLQVIDVSKLP